MNWNKKFLDLATLVAGWSKDRSTQVGTVIVDDNNNVLSVGYNGFPRGVNDEVESRHERPAKYYYTEHAERNAVYAAARNGVKLEGATIYLLWKWPCADCARAIVQAGIKKVISYNKDFPGLRKANGVTWEEHFKASIDILSEGGVEVVLTKDNGEYETED